MNILLVDDEEMVAQTLGRLLQWLGHCSQTASSGTAALHCLEAQEPDLVLTDVQMPGMDGIALLQEIRKRHPQVPVVVMSGFGAALGQTARENGAWEFLEKPVQLDRLLACIEGVVAERRAQGIEGAAGN